MLDVKGGTWLVSYLESKLIGKEKFVSQNFLYFKQFFNKRHDFDTISNVMQFHCTSNMIQSYIYSC